MMKIMPDTASNKFTMSSITLVFSIVLLIGDIGLCEESSNNSRKNRAIGSANDVIEHYPYTVSLHDNRYTYEDVDGSLNGELTSYCVGFVVSRRNVVTACHCVNHLAYENLQIRVGSSFHDKGGKLINAKKFACHPKYQNKDFTIYDIAVVRLAEFIKYGPNVNKIDLYKRILRKDEALPNMAFAAGWGMDPIRFSRAPVLQALELPVISKNQCKADFRDVIDEERRVHPSYDAVFQDQICAGTKTINATKSLCLRDSGSPLIIVEDNKEYVIGVAVNVEDPHCRSPSYPNIFSEIAYHVPWLEKHIKFD